MTRQVMLRFVLLVIATIPFYGYATDKILIINSYHSDLDWVSGASNKIQEVLGTSMSTIYMIWTRKGYREKNSNLEQISLSRK